MRSRELLVLTLLLSLIVVGVSGFWAFHEVRCHYKTNGESIGGSPAETYGEYAKAVQQESAGCTDVVLVDLGGEVIENPSEDLPIESMTGRMLSEPIVVNAR